MPLTEALIRLTYTSAVSCRSLILPAFRCVLMDLDGTLTDPSEGIAASLRYALAKMGIAPPTEHELRLAVGPPLRETFATMLGTEDPKRIDLAVRLYRERYSITGLLENQVYPGLPEMLIQLKAAGCHLYVATAKPAVYAKRIVDHFGLAPHFVQTYGSELDGALENKSELIRFILDKEGLNPRHTAMVGDRSHDMVAAKANSVYAVGVCWGYGSAEELQAAGADLICASQKEVLRFLTNTSTPHQRD